MIMLKYFLPAVLLSAYGLVIAEDLFSSSSVSSSACVASAINAGRRLFAAQETFFTCFQGCSNQIFVKTGTNASEVPEFTLNFVSLAKSAGLSICSNICFGKIVGDVIPADTVKDPMSLYRKIVDSFRSCIATETNDNYFATDLAQFNLDHINKSPVFLNPKGQRLFSIFYPEHLHTFWSGMSLYGQSSSKCPEILMTMKASLSSYTNSLNLCQHWCLVSLEDRQSKKFGFFSTFVDIARCQLDCFYLLREDPSPTSTLLQPVAEIYHYLQYCLWHSGAYKDAIAHGASYSFLNPADTSVYDYYVGGGKVSADEFLPRPEAVHFKEQLQALTSIVKMADDVASGIMAGASSNIRSTISSFKTYNSPFEKSDLEWKESEKEKTCKASSHESCLLNTNNLRVVANFSGVEGHRRYVVDDVLKDSECLQLRNINTRAGRMGDGYPNTKKHGSPYTDHETYVGLPAIRLAELAADGVLLPEEVRLYINTVNTVLEKSKKLFSVKDLYLYYVHLVCREFRQDKGEHENESRKPSEDPSHPIHADNCAIQPNGDCLYNDPLLTPRNYSSVLYLNDDFEGGEFFFAHRPNKSEDLKVNGRCGRFVSFHASEFHGVKAVTQGTRCSLALWLTMDKTKEEKSFEKALKVVKQLEAMKDMIPPEPVGPDRVEPSF